MNRTGGNRLFSSRGERSTKNESEGDQPAGEREGRQTGEKLKN